MEATDVATEIITEMISKLPFSQAVQRTTIRNIPEDVMPKIADLVETKNSELLQELMRRESVAYQHTAFPVGFAYWRSFVEDTEHQNRIVERRNEIRELLMDLSREQ
jgi:hypothetical protein